MSTRLKTRLEVGTLLCGLVVVGIPPVVAQAPDDLESGRRSFMEHCASCHGSSGIGDGPVASTLKVPPADLTLLSKENDGDFPFWRVERTIDGRKKIPGHGTRDMPIWGTEFKREVGGFSEAHVKGRILELIQYVRSMQVD